MENIDKVLDLMMSIRADISGLSIKIDEFSNRLDKLEQRDEQRAEEEHNLHILITSLQGISGRTEKEIKEFDERIASLETDVTTIKNNWGWLCALFSFAGAVAGFIIKLVVHIFGGNIG